MDVFVKESAQLSLADLHLLTQQMPRGIKWGDKTAYRETVTPQYSQVGRRAAVYEEAVKGKRSQWEPADIRILAAAIKKTKSAIGEEHAAEIGKNVRKIIADSYAHHRRTAANDSEFYDNLNKFLLKELGTMLGGLVGSVQRGPVSKK
jgi:hypothetical protein